MFSLIFCLLWVAGTTGFLRHHIDENTEYKAHIDVEVFTHGRIRRTVDIKDHPESYDLVFLIERSKVHLHLVQNNDIKTKVPTFILKDGLLIKDELEDDEESTFYQDRRNGASFTVQFVHNHSLNMFGSFIRNGEGYFLQSADTNGSINNREMHKFEIIKQKIKPLLFDEGEITSDNFQRNLHKSNRHRRATGTYQIELLMVCDYTVYNFWYTQSTKSTVTEKVNEAISSIRQYYAFVVNGMDAVYKNIQTSSYTISVLFSSLIISKTPNDASWTETVQKIDTPRNSVNASVSLDKFKTWIKTKFSTLPVHDHAMLFSKYDLVGKNGSHDLLGLAYVGGICGESAQSIIEDDFDYGIVITTSHELGHSLSSQHDGKGNNCHESDGYVMAAARKVHLGATATHPWIFSNCSTNYFTSKLDSLDSQNKNCMKTLGPNIDPTALAKYDKLYAGQAFDADVQCKLTHGNSSSVCKSLFKGNYTTICDRMYCKDPTDSSKCIPSKAWDRTVCGNKKWCVYGVCTNDVNAPVSNAGQLYDPDTQCKHIYGNNSDICRGIYKGNLTYICGKLYCRDPANPKSCHEAVAEEGTQCGNKKWCVDGACTFDTKAPESNAGQLYDPDTQCKHIYGNSSDLCRGIYKGNLTYICGKLYCRDPANPKSCHEAVAEEGTQCGNKKWCVDGACTFDTKAPESNAGMLYDPDTQCRHIYGNSSELSRWSYKGDFTSICGELNCKNPKDPTSYIQTEAAEERTQCGNKKWCVDGACTFDSKAPSGIDNCLFGDEKSNVFSNGWSCAKMVQVAPNNCPAVPIKCCASCAPPTTTTPSSTSKSPTTITTPTTTRIPTTTTFSTTITTPSTSKIPTTT